jgi:hypothetical protein
VSECEGGLEVDEKYHFAEFPHERRNTGSNKKRLLVVDSFGMKKGERYCMLSVFAYGYNTHLCALGEARRNVFFLFFLCCRDVIPVYTQDRYIVQGTILL